MARPPLNLHDCIAQIPRHVAPMPPESERPIEHYKRGATDAYNSLLYFERKIKDKNVYPAPYERHATQLRSNVLLSLIAVFERFVKEVAALCVDHVAPFVLDDRLSVFRANARSIAANFHERSLGKALCESDTWLDCKEINERFRKLLADPFGPANFNLFPQASDPADGRRQATLDTLFQIRHTIAHNVSVITGSDAARLRLLVKAHVEAPMVLLLNGAHLRYAKKFLDQTASWANERIADRLEKLLSVIHHANPSAFDPQAKANEVARQFNRPILIAEAAGVP